MRWAVAALVVVHGLLHLLGAARGLGWADVTQLRDPIGTRMGAAWLAAAVLVVAAGVLLAFAIRWWWALGAVALLVSQTVIFTSWGDAKVGTVANVILLAAIVHGYASQGPTSARAEYNHRVETALTGVPAGPVVTEADLAHLPAPVADYVRQSGALGRPGVTSFEARFHGRIRSGASAAWMSYTGEQVNTYGPRPTRLFFMDATMFGLPVDVLHAYVGPSATMRVKALSLLPLVNAAGPEMDRGETVTMFNDLCLLAPAALVSAPITWETHDDHRVRGTFTNGTHTVSADLIFNENHELVDFVSRDRLRASRDGKSFIPQRWSTPVRDYRTIDSRRVFTHGEARWHAPDPEGEFVYLEFTVDELAYNPATTPASGARDDAGTGRPTIGRG